MRENLLSNSSTTSRRTFCDFQTPRGVENTRRRYFSNEPVFREKIKEEAGLIYVIAAVVANYIDSVAKVVEYFVKATIATANF